ncbi:hypothetical protein [Paenibacillus sp. BIHB 4019]|uniref:hypothetical protein n=1 Tax=Paenibacillus sp. BIHB 4019 TaxID=1870819 RepID=UPI001559C8A3|nr:hypothetical protein [Paenibacillus sp. BIHB 4019]
MNYCSNFVGGEQDRNLGNMNQHHKSNKHKSNQHKSNQHKSSNENGTKSFLDGLVGQFVKINRGGPESLQGTLVAVKNDYLVLWTKEGIVYVSTSHVKSITDFPSNKSKGRTPHYIHASSFIGVIRALNQKFVQINWGGPEKMEGFIAEVGSTSLLLVVNREVVQIQLFHIKTIKLLGQNTSRGDRSGGNKNRTGGNNNGGDKNRTGGANNGGDKNRTGGTNSGGNKNRTGGSNSGGNKNRKNNNKSGNKNGNRSGKRN